VGLRLAFAVLAIVASTTTAHAQRGVPSNGFPSWQERVLLVYVNRARADPATDLAGCTQCADKACYSAVVPLDWAFGLNRSSRFHSANLEYANAFQHDSPCALVANLSSVYVPTGTCLGEVSCACVGGVLSGSTVWSDRINLFYSTGTAGENIAYGYATPSQTFYQWLWEPDASSTCGFSSANGHRYNILDGVYRVMGNGFYTVSRDMWTQDFSGGTTVTGTLIAGGHEPQYVSGSVDFRVNYYDTGAPSSALVNVDGTCTAMTLERGTSTNATYHVAMSLAGSTCHSYRFEFVRPGGATIYLPGAGSYGAGGSSSCPDYMTTAPTACGAPPDQPPTVATAASANPNPVTAKATALTVLGADDGGETNLVYTWAASGPATVTFNPNGTNAAKSSTATFAAAGAYTLTVTIRDKANQTATSSVAVTVKQTPTTIAVAPSTASVPASQTQQFTATVYDQFTAAVAMPPAIAWTVGGGGTISASGLFTAGQVASGPYTVTANGGGVTGTAQVTVAGPLAPTVAQAAAVNPAPVTGATTTASVLGASGGGESTLVYTWTGAGPAAITAMPNGTNAAKSATITFATAGSYTLTATIADPTAQTATSSVAVSVVATATTVMIAPPTAAVVVGTEQAFTAAIADQFAHVDPLTPAWTVDGGGAVDAQGRFVAGATPGGPYMLTAAAGGATGTASIVVVDHPDTTPPTVTILEPADGADISGPTTIVADASDDVGVAQVEFDVAGEMLVATQAPWQVTWDPGASQGGTFVIAATARDYAGNASAPATITVHVVAAPGGADAGKSGCGCRGSGDGGGVLIVLAAGGLLRRRRR
jgi:MYXO-CTERM domain-containing protein